MAKKKQDTHKKNSSETASSEPAGADAPLDTSGELEAGGEPEAESDLTETELLQQELELSREEARTNHELYLRAMADMENLRKRSQREKEDLAKFGNEMILREILPVVDNLERALEHAVQDKTNDGLLAGVQMTLDQFGKVLEKFNVVPIESVGQVFDPALHQAMGQQETGDFPANTVAQEMQKGYLLNDRLLRPALVMVAKAPAVAEPERAGEEKQDTE
ncbi:MAG: nucleotide exchange factor GrpE [Desulfuromonadales bacterium]|nr:nucleotide exchange factor GrpE [Desulfuromonadales bacterium]